MKSKLFAIVGYTDWGKSNTLYELFERGRFFPEKSPISQYNKFGNKEFIVINASNEDKIINNDGEGTKRYLNRFERVQEKHYANEEAIFLVTISLIFDGGIRDARLVFEKFNSLTEFEVYYIVLIKGWKKTRQGDTLSKSDIMKMKSLIKSKDSIYLFEDVIESDAKSFNIRTEKIVALINQKTTH